MIKVQPQPPADTPRVNYVSREPSHIHIPRPSRLREAARAQAEQAEPYASQRRGARL